jgi:3-hydroxyacyl-CoA dehydrogenase/enoyl-CoA hydratase/3-hydroxybutyryl-CoA epimerase
VDQLAESDEELAQLARAWILSGKDAVQPWDRKEDRIPGGAVQSPGGYQTFMAAAALVREKTHGKYPAPLAILRCVYEGLQLPFDRGMEIEGKLFARCLASPVAANTIRTMFFGLNAIKKGAGRPPGVPPARFQRVAVLGAGMMGSGIAYAAASRGMEVVLKDVDEATAARGKAQAEKLLARRVEKGRTTAAEAEAVLARIRPTSRADDLAGSDARDRGGVREPPGEGSGDPRGGGAGGERGHRGLEHLHPPHHQPGRLFRATPELLGLHFFSPVDRMPLVEIIRGRETSEATVAQAFDFVRALGKTPIVVNDGRGFYTSRVFAAYIHAGIAALQEGVAPALIENAGRMAGHAGGAAGGGRTRSASTSSITSPPRPRRISGRPDTSPGAVVAKLFVETLHRSGRKAGRGFYDYPADGKKQLWPGLAEHFPRRAAQPAAEDLERRLLHAQALERRGPSRRGSSPRRGTATWAPSWAGGSLPGRVGSSRTWTGSACPRFVRECEAMGEDPPELLRRMAREGRSFHDGA